jgi:hypothetical protein
MRARMHGLGLGLLLVVATSVPALAQQTGPSTSPSKTEYPSCVGKEVTKADSEAAHRKYLAGKDDYDEGKYDSAITIFQDAYKKDCTKHELLVIISRAHELNHNLSEAVRALEIYLERNPSSSEAQTHRNKIKNLQDRLAEERKKAAATPAPTATGTAGGPTPSAGEPQGHTIYPWIVVGVGGAAIVTGAVLVVIGASNFPENCTFSTNACNPNPNETTESESYKQRRNDAGSAKGAQIGGMITLAGGAALVVGGLIWHFLEPTGPKESAKTKVQPQLGPGFAGLGLTGRF